MFFPESAEFWKHLDQNNLYDKEPYFGVAKSTLLQY